MHDDADIIEISSQASSPLPELFLPTHSRPKGRGNATRSSTKGKGKGKMKQQDVEVIELTDSSDKDKDDEDDEIQVIQARSLSKSLKSQWTIVFDDEDAGDEPSRVRPHGAEAGPSRVNGIGDSQAEPDTGSVENTQVKGRVSNEFQAVGLGDDRDVLEWFSGNLGDSLEPPQPEVQPPPHSPSPSASPASVSGSSFSNVNGLEPGAHPPPVPLPPPPLLESPEETMSRYVAQILEIVPDVDPEHCSSLIADHVHLSDATVERILHILFEDPGYPRKRKDKGKRKADGGAEGSVPSNKKVKENGRGQGRVAGDHGDDLWISVERPFLGGINYHQLALVGLHSQS
jgi:TRIAD3 protein (E3 ubiquitin-protein ligase RNF216)